MLWLLGCLCYLVEPMLRCILGVVVMCTLVWVWIVCKTYEWKRSWMGLWNLVKKGTSQKYKCCWWIFYSHPKEHWNGRYSSRNYVAKKGILPCVGCVGVGLIFSLMQPWFKNNSKPTKHPKTSTWQSKINWKHLWGRWSLTWDILMCNC